MTLADLNASLQTIPEFKDKVAYRAFPVGKAPVLPFITYLVAESDNFNADNRVYHIIQQVDVELYTKKKSPATESLVEDKLTEIGLVWDKYEEYIDAEDCYQIIYTVEI